jgi:hypothetical protein
MEGGVDGIGIDCRLKRNALLDIERLLPLTTGSRNRGLKRAPVAAAGNGRAGCMQAAGGIDVTVSLRPEIGLEWPLCRRLALGPFELEVGNHAKLLEARKVGRVDKLQMGDLVAVVPIAVRSAG